MIHKEIIRNCWIINSRKFLSVSWLCKEKTIIHDIIAEAIFSSHYLITGLDHKRFSVLRYCLPVEMVDGFSSTLWLHELQ